MSDVDQARYRHALAHFATGVAVVTSLDGGGGPVGFACQSFAALSLDPPLVLFCPSLTSATWPNIERSGLFVVNVLSEEQREISRTFGRSGSDKFAGVGWHPAGNGAPVLDGVLTWAACRVESVTVAGDHRVVIGRVTELGDARDGQPLLFFRGRYTSTGLPPREAPEVVDTILSWSRHDDWI